MKRTKRFAPFVYCVAALAAAPVRPVFAETEDGGARSVFASGAGEAARHSVGTTVAGGMFVSTFLNLIFIPVLYVVVQGFRGVGRSPERA